MSDKILLLENTRFYRLAPNQWSMALLKRFESNYKTLGYAEMNEELVDHLNTGRYKQYILMFYLPPGYTLKVDFTSYKTEQPSFFFLSNNQHFQIWQTNEEKAGHFIFFNTDFYCVQIHDAEVACDGILFNNIYNLAMTPVAQADEADIEYIFKKLIEELDEKDVSQEEMIRTYLKQLIIMATRMWKIQQFNPASHKIKKDIEIYRAFSRMVGTQFRKKHTVTAYADQLGMAAKNLTATLSRLNLPAPSDIIKDRLVLEAKRLLCHSAYSAKEIAHQLGFDDPAYFNRLFTKRVGASPGVFKKQYLSEENVQR